MSSLLPFALMGLAEVQAAELPPPPEPVVQELQLEPSHDPTLVP